MNDWLTNEQAHKQRQEHVEAAKSRAHDLEMGRRTQFLRDSYDKNKETFDHIFGAVRGYTSRAESMGYDVNAISFGHSLIIEKGTQGITGTSLSLEPYGDQLKVKGSAWKFNGPQRYIPLTEVSNHHVEEWVKWVATDGKSHLSRSYKSIKSAVFTAAIIVALVVIAAIVCSVIS